jgi:hypothetical protein
MSEQMTRQPRRANPPITLIGAPTDIGAGHRGSSMGPEALRVAGIEAALRRLGCAIEDRGNIAGPVNPDASSVNGYRGTSRKRPSGVKPSATRSMMRCDAGLCRSCSAAITLSRSGRSPGSRATVRQCKGPSLSSGWTPTPTSTRRTPLPPATSTACRSPLLLVMVPGA